MTAPSPSWTTVRVFGTYRHIDGTPHSGLVRFTVSQRIVNNTDDVIFPAGSVIDAPLDDSGSISVQMPAVDDPDNSPGSWSIQVQEKLTSGGGATYFIAPTVAMASSGLDLRAVILPGTSGVPATVDRLRGVAGGIAGLDAQGDVIDANGVKVKGSGSGGSGAWLSGSTAPASALGNNGDLYLNTTTQDVSQKAAGAWSVITNIKGAQGAPGPAGAPGSTGAAGATWRTGAGVPSNALGANGDLYLNVTTSDVYQRTAGTYSVVANIKGAQGPQGVQGIQGVQGPQGPQGPAGTGGTGGATIDDTSTSTSSAWSSSKTNTAIAAATAALVNAAPTTLDTLGEIATQLAADENAAAALTTSVGNRVRFDAAQTLTAAQQLQANNNTGVGDPTTDFVSTFNAALV